MMARFCVIIAFVLFPGSLGGQGIPKSPLRGASIKTISPHEEYIDSLMYEGFEDTTLFPPSGWDVVEISGTQGGITPIPWHLSISPEPFQHTGIGGTSYGWGYDLDGWLRILSLDFSLLSFVELSFWWMSSYYWHVFPNDNGDLFVKVSTDGGFSWDTLWTFGDSLAVITSGCPWPWGDWTWYQATLDLSAYCGETDVTIGFHVVADDNADIGMDDILLDTIQVPVSDTGMDNVPWIFTSLSNPARSQVRFLLGTHGEVDISITVYDNAGRVVTVINSSALAPGNNLIVWDGLDACGYPAPAGVYFIECVSSNYRMTESVILLR